MGKRILEAIYATRRLRVEQAESALPLAALKDRAKASPPALDFVSALRMTAPAIIAEVKQRSPSRGVLRDPFDHLDLARAYVEGGAAALSVVTEPDFFGGSLNWLSEIRQATKLPLLRKDFLFCEYQVWESRVAGADAVLLIVAMLNDSELARLVRVASEAGLQCLVEVHDEREADRARKLNVAMVGVNNRDLQTFKIQLETSERLAGHLPAGALRVAESGIDTHADCKRLLGFGFEAFLVGEALVTAADPAGRLRSLRDEHAPR
jgi:indole-3-glycerol phosphate synthase